MENRRKAKCLCYNGIMLKAKMRVAISAIGIFSVAAGLATGTLVARHVSAEASPTGSANATFQVNVVESLTVEVTTPGTWASGDINQFIRNDIGLHVVSNNPDGFTATMYSSGGTNLTNVAKSSATLPTMSASAQRSAFPTNAWGYSLDDGEGSGNYSPMTSSTSDPITVLTGDGTVDPSQGIDNRDKSTTIYFGAKADASQASGTYAGTVVINVVTGKITENDTPVQPVTPTNPATPGADGVASYSTSGVGASTGYSGTTTYTEVDGNTTSTTVSGGDTRSSYTAAQGVTKSSVSNRNTAIAAALATTAGVAAVSSGLLFFAYKRRKDDDDEEESQA